MENKDELSLLNEAKTMVDCAKIIKGVSYTNGRIKQEIVSYCSEVYGIDIIAKIKENNKHFCLECGKEITSNRKFCSSSCSAKYNNSRRKLSTQTKKKISETLNKYFEQEKQKHFIVCETCGKTFWSRGLHTRFCSPACSNGNEETKGKLRNQVLKRLENNTFSGWKTRNIRSYPEKFWEEVLKRNSIKFISEDFSTKKYFLDFLIEKNGKKVDLEIDGKQHEKREEHDKERDEFLTKSGFIVYRIKWNSINSEKGKNKMKEKIDSFLDFYNKL